MKTIKITLTSIIAALACAGIIHAATTIGTNINTTGTLGVTGASTFTTASSTGIVKFAQINSDTGEISFGNENLTTTGTLDISGLTTLGNASTSVLTVSGNSYLATTTISADININGSLLTQSLQNNGVNDQRHAHSAQISKDILWISGTDAGTTDAALFAIDTRDLSTISTFIMGGGGGFTDFEIRGNHIYGMNFADMDLYVIDISDPNNPVVDDSYSHVDLDGAHEVYVDGHYAYICSYNGTTDSLVIVDIANPKDIKEVSNVEHSIFLNCHDIEVRGEYLYMAHYIDGGDYSPDDGRISIFSLAELLDGDSDTIINSDDLLDDIDHADITGSCTNANCIKGSSTFTVRGKYLYVGAYGDMADGSEGYLTVLNVEDPDAIAYVADLDISAYSTAPESFRIIGDTLFIISESSVKGGVVMVDISDPSAPSVLTSITGSNYKNTAGLVVDGEYIYFMGMGDSNTKGYVTKVKYGSVLKSRGVVSGLVKTGQLTVNGEAVVDTVLNVAGSASIGDGGLHSTGDIAGRSGIFSSRMSIGTTTSYAKLTVWGGGTGTNKTLQVVNSASTTLFSILDNGTAALNGQLSINISNANQANFYGYAGASIAQSSENGSISVGNNSTYQGIFQYDGAVGGDLYIDNTYDNDGGDIVFRTKTAGTATTTAITISGSGEVDFGKGMVPDKVTADPCGSGYPEGSIFYNDTGNVLCYCNGTDDLKVADDSACF